ncbi:MAG: hypothetical protein ROO76_22310 [Terriglobia bacterium]|nr:hypothetical protein [Terriglobia bacterium]
MTIKPAKFESNDWSSLWGLAHFAGHVLESSVRATLNNISVNPEGVVLIQSAFRPVPDYIACHLAARAVGLLSALVAGKSALA